jgi:hypothetical protein
VIDRLGRLIIYVRRFLCAVRNTSPIRETPTPEAPKVQTAPKEQTNEYINELLAEFDVDPVPMDVVKNMLDDPIPEAVKARLLKPLLPSAFKRTRQVKDEKPRLPLTKGELTDFERPPPRPLLDPDEYYTIAVENIPVLFPDGGYAKRSKRLSTVVVAISVQYRGVQTSRTLVMYIGSRSRTKTFE